MPRAVRGTAKPRKDRTQRLPPGTPTQGNDKVPAGYAQSVTGTCLEKWRIGRIRAPFDEPANQKRRVDFRFASLGDRPDRKYQTAASQSMRISAFLPRQAGTNWCYHTGISDRINREPRQSAWRGPFWGYSNPLNLLSVLTRISELEANGVARMCKPVGKADLVLAAFVATCLALGASPGRFDAPRRSGRRVDRVRKGRARGWASSGRQTWSHRHGAGGDRENAPLRRPLWALALFALLISILQRTPPVAAQASAVDWGASVAPGSCADGDPQGESWLPDRLAGHPCGLTIEPVYYGELFSNTRGGLSTNDATRYQALLDLGIEFDLADQSGYLGRVRTGRRLGFFGQ